MTLLTQALSKGLRDCPYIRPRELHLLAQCHRERGHEALADELEQMAEDRERAEPRETQAS